MDFELRKPLKPIWIHPCSRIFNNSDGEEPFYSSQELENLPYYPIICICSSISTSALDSNESPMFKPPADFQYIQGAADDTETWAPNFKPMHFWQMFDQIDSSKSNDFWEHEIKRLVLSRNDNDLRESKLYDWIGNTGLAIGNRNAARPPNCWTDFDAIINCGAPEFEYLEERNYLYLPISEGKKGQYELFNSIPIAIEFITKQLCSGPKKILVHCMQGVDRSVGIAIALLLRFGNQNNQLSHVENQNIDLKKSNVMDALIFVKEYRPISAPTRATMKRLNAYFVKES